jgi:hypothetical protein
MRFNEIKVKPILESKDESEEAKELIQKTGNMGVLAAAVKFLRNLAKKNNDEPVNPTSPAEPTKAGQPQASVSVQQQKAKPKTNDPNATLESMMLEDAMSLKDEAMALLSQVSDEDEDKLLSLISFLRKNEIYDLCKKAIDANISQGTKEDLDKKLGQMIIDLKMPFEAKEEFLQTLATGKGLWPGSDLINNLTGNIYDKLSSNVVAANLAKPIAIKLRGKMGYGPDQGPGEFLLALTGGGIDLAEKSDLVLINGKGVEVKADSTTINAAGKKGRAGGRLYATSGYNGGTGARGYVKQALIDSGVPEKAFDEYGWNERLKEKKYANLNFNKAGIANLNKLLKTYTKPGAAENVLAAIAKGFYTDLPANMENSFITNPVKNNQIDYVQAMAEFVALGHEYYKAQEGHDYIMIFNTATGGYVMIDSGEDMKRALLGGQLKLGGGMDYFDDRSKGTPQILTGNI